MDLVDLVNTVDLVDSVDKVDLVDSVDTVDLVDSAGTVTLVDSADTVDLVDLVGTVDLVASAFKTESPVRRLFGTSIRLNDWIVLVGWRPLETSYMSLRDHGVCSVMRDNYSRHDVG